MTTAALSLVNVLTSWVSRVGDDPGRPAFARATPRPDLPDAGDEPDLVARAPHDPDAFAVLYRRHVGAIHAFIYRRTRDRDLAEDITANTFERALRNIASFRWRGAGSFSAWLHRIASNLLVDHYRDTARSLALVEVTVDSDGTDHDIEKVRRALARLRPRYQQVIQLRFFAGLDADAAAAALGCSKSTLAVVQHRAVRALVRAMESGP